MKTGLTKEKVSFPFQKLKVLRNFKAVNDSLILRIAAPEPVYAPPTSTSSLYSFQQQTPVAKWLNTWTSNQKVIGSSPIESTWIFFFWVTCVIDWKKTYFSIKDFCPKLDSVCCFMDGFRSAICTSTTPSLQIERGMIERLDGVLR